MMKVGIIGSGTMGSGIAQVAATAGCQVNLFDANRAVLEKSKISLEKILIRLIEKGRIDTSEKNRIQSNINYVDSLEKLSDSDLIIEAIIENLEIKKKVFSELEKINNLKILAPDQKERMSIFSFYVENVHFNLIVKLLNDKFGIQSRGGCSCAGTYGHFLLNVDQETSNRIKGEILKGCSTEKPGWIRVSLHPTITDEEVDFVCNAIKGLCKNVEDWSKEYKYDTIKNDYIHTSVKSIEQELVKSWFSI